jgi:hypothetical protein
MSPDASNGGVALETFDNVDRFVSSCRSGKLAKDDRRLHGDHPLVLFVELTLEAVSDANLELKIIGLSTRSEALLREERRKLEDRDARPHLQRFLFSFEPLCDIVRGGSDGDGGGDESDDERFFTDLFPDWLTWLVAWASGETLTALADRAQASRTDYLAVAAGIVKSR